MIPRLDISFPIRRQWQYWFGKQYEPQQCEYLLNHARSGIILALRASLPNGGRVGVVAYNCHTIANAVVNAGCMPVFIDVTDELKIDVASISADLDAIVVTNLFGIRNNISVIREKCPNAIIIVDNAHGYGLPAEGDFSVYSINQGKFPALGEGGILVVNNKLSVIRQKIDEMYAVLPRYGLVAQCKLFAQMWAKAVAYSKICYWFVRMLKKNTNPRAHEQVVLKQMAPGIRRLYKAWLPAAENEIAKQKQNAEALNQKLAIINHTCTTGDNAFMLIAKTQDPAALQTWFANHGIETATHFAHAIDWATEFGYIPGSCPNAERLIKELLMIPTYKRK